MENKVVRWGFGKPHFVKTERPYPRRKDKVWIYTYCGVSGNKIVPYSVGPILNFDLCSSCKKITKEG